MLPADFPAADVRTASLRVKPTRQIGEHGFAQRRLRMTRR
jgi:hypothetical protein